MRLERGNAKTLLVIEEEVDLSRKKVTMIHEGVYALGRKWVSDETENLLGVESVLKTAVRDLTKGQRKDKWFGIARWFLSLGPEVLECTPELVPGAMDVGLHGTQRQVECRRDLFVGTSLHVAQQDARSILGPQLADRLLDR